MKSIAAAAAIIAACYGIFTFALWRARDRDISRFVVAGAGVEAREVPPGLTVRSDIGGYDGVAFYRLAVNPFTRAKKAYGITLDNPPYRQQRIGYPLLVFLASLGNARAVPLMMVVVNLLALIVIAAIGGALAQEFGFSGLWGVAFALYPGFILTLSRDTSEIVACMFMLATSLALARQRFVAASILLTCATLTRETALLIAIALAIVWACCHPERERGVWAGWVRRRASAHLDPSLTLGMTAAIPIAVFIVWQAILAMIWGRLPVVAGAPDMSLPFSEFAKFLAAAAPRRIYIQRLNFMECLYLAILVILAVIAWRRSRAAIEWRLAWIGYLAIAAIMPHTIWIEDFGFLRIFADLFIVTAVLIAASPPYARWIALISSAALWFHLAQHVVELH
jgi:hypothetical protein